MTLPLIVSREAQDDIAEAVEWFHDISPSLSTRFELELERIYSSIREHPQMYPAVYRKFRRALMQRFPYAIFYVVETFAVLIVGVIHQARDERTWKRRA